MKLSALFITGTIAGKADSRAKSGRQDISNDRYIWQTPRCLTVPDMCDAGCNEVITTSFGEINFTAEDYATKKHCLWTIDIPADREIKLQFTRMDLEYHNRCGYDKVHVFDGTDQQRLGRFCGPKQDGSKSGMRPYDGSKKNKPINGVMEFWDTPYETNSHTILIGFDSDINNNDFDGFTLKWSSTKIHTSNFRSVEFALDYVQRNLLKRVHKQDFADNGVIVLKRAVHSIVRNAKNSISNRPRKCARQMSDDVSDDVYSDLIKLNDGNGELIRSFKNYSQMIPKLVLDYIGTCRGSQRWNRTAARLLSKWDREIRDLDQ